jgi:hypothetical protein
LEAVEHDSRLFTCRRRLCALHGRRCAVDLRLYRAIYARGIHHLGDALQDCGGFGGCDDAVDKL